MKKGISAQLMATISEHIEHFYDENPFVKLLKLRVKNVREGAVTLAMDIENDFINFYRIAHGGVLMSIADTAMGATCLACNKKVVTLSFNINCIKAIPLGQELIAAGKAVHNGSRTMVCEAELTNTDGELIAKATGTFFVIGEFYPTEQVQS